MEKTMKARVQHKHDVEANWLKATNFTPLASEIIVYDSDENYNYPRIKIGDGETNINDLPFIVDEAKITEIISSSLEDAKNSGEFDGKDGQDGTSASLSIKYASSAWNNRQPTEWQDSIPTLTPTEKYLWAQFTKTEGLSSSIWAGVIGAYGDKGETGKTAYQYAKDGGYAGTEVEFAAKLAKEFPTKVSELTNDSQYITAAGAPVQSVNGKNGAVSLSASDVGALPSTTKIPGALSDLSEDTTHRVVTDAEKEAWNAKSNFSGSYNDLTNKPTIPSIAGLASTTYVDDAVKNKVDKDGNKVLSTNDYTTAEKNKLANIAAGAEVNVNADWNATSGDAQILNKPTLGSMAAKSSVAKSDLASDVQTSLGKADSALQPGNISDWAKQPSKPSYTKSEVGLGNVDNVKQYSAQNPPVVAQATAPTDTSVVWVDTDDNTVDEFQDAVNLALAQAKASGEFDGKDGHDGYSPVKGVDYFTDEDIKEISERVSPVEEIPSPNLVNINDTESWPFGISETEAVKGLYSWVDDEGYINIKGTTTENNTIFLMFDSGDITFEPGTYYIGFDDVLRPNGSVSAVIQFNGEDRYCNIGDAAPMATFTLTSALTVKKVDVTFYANSPVDFRGHCWMTKDEPLESYIPKGGTIEVPITPVKKEDLEKLADQNILGIFDSIGGVGDSLMSGYINPTSSDVGSDTHCYSKSWLSHIGKIVGVDVKHYSYAGATTKNWMQNQNNCHTDIIETPHEAYFLALGTNDSSDWANISVGTIADMGTNADTFYGWYAKVIARIREANPKAPIFMLSTYWVEFPAYDAAIRAMSEATENAYFIDITDMGEKYSTYRQGYHFNAIGYYYIAKSIIERASEVIIANHSDFANLGVEAQNKPIE